MQKKIYQFNSIDFLNATVDEIYYRKKHYVEGKDLLQFKGMLSAYFVQIERMFRYVYFSDISLNVQRIDLELFKRQFPFVHNTFYKNIYTIDFDNAGPQKVDGITYYTWLVEQLRNINMHAVISTALTKIFKIDEDFIHNLPKFSEDVLYIKDGVLTVAGIFGLLLPILHPKKAKYLLGYIFQQWSEVLYGLSFKESWGKQEELWSLLSSIYKTDYEVEIRENGGYNNPIEAMFGRECQYVQKEEMRDEIRFIWDVSQGTNSPKFFVAGSLQSKNGEVGLLIEKGSNVGIYFEENYNLRIENVALFLDLCSKVPPFMAVAYLYHNQIQVLEQATYNKIDQFFFKKLNHPKFYVDKNIAILCYGNDNADIREVNKSVCENLLKLFLDFEEAVVFRNDIPVYGTYSKFTEVTKKFNVPYDLTNKLIACRNFCSHEGMLDNFHYSTPTRGYRITLAFICETLAEFIEFLNGIGESEHAHWLQRDLERYILNNLIGVKYKRIFETSIKLFRSNGDWIATHCMAIKKSLGAVYNSCIDERTETILADKMKKKFSFFISPTLWETQDNTFQFSELTLYRIFEKDLEIRGEKTGVEVLEFFKTPVTNLSKISKNGKGVRLELVEEKKEGVLLVHSYKIKT